MQNSIETSKLNFRIPSHLFASCWNTKESILFLPCLLKHWLDQVAGCSEIAPKCNLPTPPPPTPHHLPKKSAILNLKSISFLVSNPWNEEIFLPELLLFFASKNWTFLHQGKDFLSPKEFSLLVLHYRPISLAQNPSKAFPLVDSF